MHFILLHPVSQKGNITNLITGAYTSRVRNLYAGPGVALPPTRKSTLPSGGKHRIFGRVREKTERLQRCSVEFYELANSNFGVDRCP